MSGEAADGSGARIEEKTRTRKRFWRWVALYRRKNYDIVHTEKLHQMAGTGTFRRRTNGKIIFSF